ncbi:hypothetical protein GCM10023334_039740 [Nonomuraea thailandensis]
MNIGVQDKHLMWFDPHGAISVTSRPFRVWAAASAPVAGELARFTQAAQDPVKSAIFTGEA